jgi:hypothetical protein
MRYKHYFLTIVLFCASGLISQTLIAQEHHYPPPKQKWNADSLGNHRAVIAVNGKEDIARGKILWRRRDFHPKDKRMILVDSTTGKRVKNVYDSTIKRGYCVLYFQHKAGHHKYYLYYLPYRHKGSNYYPKDYYPKPVKTAGIKWLESVKKKHHFAKAHLLKLEAVTPFNSFKPMELIATKAETKKLTSHYPHADYLVFPEDRLHPIKMEHDLPYRWIKSGVKETFNGTVEKVEYYAFQLGIYALKKNLKNVNIHFTSLKNKKGKTIPDTLITCINTNGISYTGQPESFQVDVPKKDVQAMWCYIKVPEKVVSGLYKGIATVIADNAPASKVDLHITVNHKTAIDHGVNKPWKMTRLPWLNSKLFQKNTVVPPYTPLKVKQDTISLLGRKLILDKTGLPAQIQSFFPVEMTSISDSSDNFFTGPMHMYILDDKNKDIKLNSVGVHFTKELPGTVEWKAVNTSPSINMLVNGHIEFDGYVSYQVKVVAKRDIHLNDIKLDFPFRPDIAKYFMGLGHQGGVRPNSIHWKWDVAHKNQDGGWIGAVNAGLHFSLRDQHYTRPLNTNFYRLKPLVLPSSWGNNNNGGINIDKKGKSILVDAYSGGRTMQAGDTLYYDFNLLITPFHALKTHWHFKHRYFHAYKPVDTVKSWGANVINLHQGTFLNPYINYPFIANKQLKAYVDSAHQSGLKVKIYNTVRELSNWAYELYPLKSLGHEIFPGGNGGGYSWLQEHLDGDYIAGWYTPGTHDAAIVDQGHSRWLNYYVEGINWLVKNIGIDGLYLDDVAYNRVTMKRIKRALLQHGHPGIIDLHSANQYDKRDGWNNSANLYMTLFPYINRLWFGEYFDYDHSDPDFFLTEVSGIPFGLMSEMLQGGGNPWRGMIYGMTSRAPRTDTRPIWKVWNMFGIENSQMIGYWVPDSPVKTDNPHVLATVYKKKGKALVSIASWAKTDTTIHLNIDWEALGIDPTHATITAPAIKDFQPSAEFTSNNVIPVKKQKGWLLIIK